MSMLVEDSSPSGQSHHSTPESNKPDLTSRAFLRLSSMTLPFFRPHLREISFSFFVPAAQLPADGQRLDAGAGIFLIRLLTLS